MIDWVLGLVGTFLYPLFSVIFICLDGLQNLFFALAGVGDIGFGNAQNGWSGQQITAGNTGGETDTGLIYYLFQNSLVKNLLLSIMLLALFLIIIFTVMAFIKNAYAAKQKSWKEIVGNSIKGLANFILLPVFCLLGVWLANILLQAINGATSSGGATQMSRKLFLAAAYNSNEFRNGDANATADPEKVKELQVWIDTTNFIAKAGNLLFDLDLAELKNLQTGKTNEYYANIVDKMYGTSVVSIYDWYSVESWYALWEINYLVLIVGGVFMLYALGALAFGMVRRMFLLVILFVVSPAICALYPLDEGKAVQSWSGEVKKNVLSAHGSVAAINIFYALIPLIDKLHFSTFLGAWTGFLGAWAGIDDLLQLFILVSGLMCVKEFTGLLSGFIGGEDAYGKASGQIKSTLGTIGKTAIGTAGVFAVAAGAKKAGGSFFGSLASQGKNAAMKSMGLDTKGVKDKYKEGQEHAHDAQKSRNERAKSQKAKEDADIAAGLGYRDGEGKYVRNSTEYETVRGSGFVGGVKAAGRNVSKSIVGRTGRKIAHAVGYKNKDDVDYTNNEEFDNMMAKLKGNDEAQEELLRRRTLQLNESHGAVRMRTEHKTKEERSKLRTEKVATVEKEKEEWERRQNRPQTEESIVAKTKTLATASEKSHVAQQELKAAEAKVTVNGNLDLKTMDDGAYNQLVRRANATDKKGKFTNDAKDAQRALEKEDNKRQNVKEYKEAKKNAEELEDVAQQAAESLQKILESAGEAFKGQMKTSATSLAKEIKNSLDKNLSAPDMVENFTNKISQLIKENKDGDKKLIALLQQLLDQTTKQVKNK